MEGTVKVTGSIQKEEEAASGMQVDAEKEKFENAKDEIRRLRLQVTQLKNVIKKLTGQTLPRGAVTADGGQGQEPGEGRKRKKALRDFDFSLYRKRRVMLRVAYFGWDYHGFAVQEVAGKTIESEMFRALQLTRLIEGRETSNYHRCGRTDKGVSAFHQVISIDVRTNLLEGEGVYDYEGCRAQERRIGSDGVKEIEFCKILNSNLPDHIQVIAWSPCRTRDFSARFDCIQRTYKYYFPVGELDLDRINDSGRRLCGEHDFRNFCKLDVNNGVVNYVRRIDSARAEYLEDAARGDPYAMCVLTITGKAFLWHQIRCIISILFRVGEGRESPSIVEELLDFEKNPCRPQYGMSSEIPLNLFFCEYDNVTWHYEDEAMAFVLRQFQAIWTQHQVKATMIRDALGHLERNSDLAHIRVRNQNECLVPKNKVKTYVPLLEMMKCPSLQDKISKNHGKKRRTNTDVEIQHKNTDEI